MSIANIIVNIGTGKALATLIVSMIPVVELRGAIPVGVSLGLPVWKAAVVSIVGNMLPVPFIIAFARIVFNWLRGKSKFFHRLVDKLETHAKVKASTVKSCAFWGLMLFVAVPLPGTGAWTGALIASVLDMRMNKALPSIFTGVCIAGLIVSLATAGVLKLAC
jgi:uncharacterized membrane protein